MKQNHHLPIQFVFSDKFRNSAFVQETLRVLKGYPHIEDLLGEDVQQCRLDLSNDFTKKDPQYAQVLKWLHCSEKFLWPQIFFAIFSKRNFSSGQTVTD